MTGARRVGLLDRYLARAATRGLGQMLVLVLAADGLFALLDAFGDIDTSYGVTAALTDVALATPWRLLELGPYVALLGAMAGLGPLAGSAELTVMRAAGRTPLRIAGAALVPALALLLVIAVTLELVAGARPSAADGAGALWWRHGSEIVHARVTRDGDALGGIVSFELSADGGIAGVRMAERARPVAGAEQVLLEDADVMRFGADAFQHERRAQLVLDTGRSWRALRLRSRPDPSDLALRDLYRLAAWAPGQSAHYRLALWTRLVQPVAAASLVLLGVAFLFGPLREQGTGRRMLTGLAVGLVFRFAQQTLAPLSLVSGMSPAFAALAPAGLALTAGVWLLRRFA